ncbi:hypothetical protein QYE76_026320 [Lolium multiflorum]|uniref:DUF4283 domain-containing protein n=1 Tax=Lolium multiflorum TaxID=4521 RepID=A0AAD8RK78_LOLMU|nr:hypothetical protein QYE76_026320 [Lolium multiflorum]
MKEAWFRIKGIPMKFRNKSTAYYAASLVGKPLALDKNYLRHFAFVRVKIGSQDLALVPNSRIGEIKKGFYEFQYSRELFDPSSNAGNKSAVPVDTLGDGGDQGTPKRQRMGMQDSDAGSQSAPPKVSGNYNGSHKHATLQASPLSRKDTGKRKLFEMEPTCNPVENMVPPCYAPIVSSSLSEVHKEVVDALASLPSQSAASSSSQMAPDSYKQFLTSLARSDSDKAFTIQKEYKHLLDPIDENMNEDIGPSDELVDYDSSDNSQASDTPYLTQGQGILALAAPSLRDERTAVVIPVDGSQPELDSQEEPLSQVDNPTIDVEIPGDGNPLSSGGDPQQPAPRMSSRIVSLGTHNTRIGARTMGDSEASNISGLHGEQDASELRAGADGLMRLAAAAGAGATGSPGQGNLLQLENKNPDDAKDGAAS